MELRVLRYFLVVAREENITRAAKLLHITQPTLSRQLMQLEEELGVTLFRRSKHSIRLTEDGMLLRRRAQELIDLADKTQRELTHENDVISGNIAIGCGETSNLQYIAACMAAFQRIHGEVQFSIYTGMADDVKERIENGLLDFGILISPVDISKYNFLALPAKDKWVALMQENDELAAKSSITPVDLEGRNVITAGRESVNNMLQHWFGTSYDKIRITAMMNLSSYNKMLLAKENVGIALGLDFGIDTADLVRIPLSPSIENGSFFVWKKNQRNAPAADAFIAFCRSYLKELTDTE